MLKFCFDKRTPAGFFLTLTILSWLVISSYLTIVKLINCIQIAMHNTEWVLVRIAGTETWIYTLKRDIGERAGYSYGKFWAEAKLNEATTFILQPYNNGKHQCSRDSSGGG